MATGKAAAKSAAPAVKLVALSDDEYDAIKIGGGPGRQAKPSARLTEVREALAIHDTQFKDGYPNDAAGWYIIRGTAANSNDVNARELRKAAKQLTAERDDKMRVVVEVRPRKNHPKHGDFVAFRVSVKPVEDETPGTESESGDAGSGAS